MRGSRIGRLKKTKRREENRWGCGVSYSHLEVRDELSHSDLLCYLLVKTLAVQDHALQDGQGPLKDGHVHHGLAHVPCNLKPGRGKSVRALRAQGSWTAEFLMLPHKGSLLSDVLPTFGQLALGGECYLVHGCTGQEARDSIGTGNSISNYNS